MMNRPLLISSVITHAARYHGDVEIVSLMANGYVHRYTYAECETRARRLARGLQHLDVSVGDRVGTLAWNTFRHLEIYYAVAGIGAICHTINPRLHPEQIKFIVNDAKDEVVCFDESFSPIIDQIASACPCVRHWVALPGAGECATESVQALDFEALMGKVSEGLREWPEFDELTPSGLCYTSGSTGNPKGVLYTHRSTILHSYGTALPDSLNCSSRDVIMPVVPMFHVNAWGLPYTAPIVGAKLVLPGEHINSAAIYQFMEAERVTLSAGVPTVWQGLVQYMEEKSLMFSTLKQVAVGGAIMPKALRQKFKDFGVEAIAAWGMTETSPFGTCARLRGTQLARSPEAQDALLDKQGRVPFGVDLKIVGPDGDELPRDGAASGELMIRGHWVVDKYFGHERTALCDGWFPTGDMATIDPDGFLQITDRLKDVIKSGGEWISSVEIESAALQHAGVAMAACVAVPHPKWGERPLLFVVPGDGVQLDVNELRQFIAERVAKWAAPDEVLLVERMPISATGKIHKLTLRENARARSAPATSGSIS